ncbi:MAG: hypothetical protein Q8835_02950 [Sweet potato little leaf phytoplasma]|nr:hypothetical protein [Sweet potato little leaf phytoplasma]
MSNDLSEEVPEANLDNVLRLWMICVRAKTLSQVYLPTHAMKPHIQITQCYRSWWWAKNRNFLEKGRDKLVASAIPFPPKPKFPKKVGNDNGGKRIRMLNLVNFVLGIMMVIRVVATIIIGKGLKSPNNHQYVKMNFLMEFRAHHNFLNSLHHW